MALETLILLATLVVLVWLHSRWRHSYWTSKGIATPPDSLPIIGHFHKSVFYSQTTHEYYHKCAKKFYDASMFGIYEFLNPVLVTWNTEIMKHIFVKDFNHFTDRRDFNMKTGSERDEVMSEMLSIKQGAEWKSLRTIMTPTFTSGKIKSMFPLVCAKADALVKFSMAQASKQPHVDMKRNFGRYTLDTIASCAFGIECNSLVNEDDIFTRKVETFFHQSFQPVLKGMLFYFLPRVFSYFNLSLNTPEADFFIDVVKETVAARKRGEKRGDFLDLLLEAQANSDNKHVLSDRTLVAQSLLFIVAGYDTTASLLAFSSFLLAKNMDQQQRLREEVRQLLAEHGDITYQGIMEAKLLDACLQESLRIYPPAGTTERCCTETYKLPGTDITVKPGQLIQVPIWSIHHDPHHWPNPEAFIPDRFLPENKANIHPFTHLPFGVGPRNCIALRFALLEAKVALAKLLLASEIKPSPEQQELVVVASNGLLRPKGGLKLVLEPLRE